MTSRQYQQAKRVFEAAVERDSETWPAFLDQACGQDTELREHVELLLRERETADSFLDEPVWRRRREAFATAAAASEEFSTRVGGATSAGAEGATADIEAKVGAAATQNDERRDQGGISAVFRDAFSKLKSASGVLWHRSAAGAGGGAIRPAPDSTKGGEPAAGGKSSTKRRHWGHLEIFEKLGEVGFGAVYRAWDPTLEREVALKVIGSVITPPSGLGSSKFQEARMLARIRHPNVVVVYGVNSHSGRVGLWMEFIRGRTLEEILSDQGPMSAREAAVIGLDLCQAVAAVHEAGLVHRDIKAQNVMREQGGRIVLMDFGLGHDQRTGDGMAGLVAGTPHYMAPELLEGKPASVESDIYALGVTHYHLATGEFPIEEDAVGDMVEAHAAGRVRPLRDARADLAREFVDVVERAISPNPADRFHSVGEMEQALAKAIGTRPVAVSLVPAKRKWFLKPRIPLAVALVVALFALAGLFGTFGPKSARERFGSGMSLPGVEHVVAVLENFGIDFAPALPEEIRLAVLPFQPGDGELGLPGLLDGFTEAVTEQVSGLEAFREDFVVIPVAEIFDYEGGDLEGLARGVGANLAVSGKVFHKGRGLQAELEVIDAATGEVVDSVFNTELARDAVELRNRLVTELAAILRVDLPEEALADLHSTEDRGAGRAYGFYLRGRGYLQRHDELENIDRAIQLFHRALGEDAQYAAAYGGLGEAYWRKYELRRDSILISRALQFANTAVTFGGDEPQIHITLGLIHLDTGRTEEALADFGRALEQNPRDVNALYGLARAYERSHALQEAEDTLKRAIVLRPNLWTGYKQLGLYYGSQGKFKQAIAQFREVAALTPDNAQSYLNLGGYHYFLGEFDEAATMWERSVELAPRHSALANLGQLLLGQGKFVEAKARFQQAIELNPNRYSLWTSLAACYRNIGDREKQEAAENNASSLAEDALRVNPRETGALTTLAYHYAVQGRRAEAVTYAQSGEDAAPNDAVVL